ncbi:MAG: ABC transporter ATP-binding protein, partial [Gammaproteobacteria bacterium]
MHEPAAGAATTESGAGDVLLAARGLTRRFGHRTALAGIDITLRRGEVLGFLGLNGAGKTTTMQILSGALVADAGRVEVCGHDLARAPRDARAALGYLPQTPPLYDDMLVDEYLALCARLHAIARSAVAAAVARARARCGLADVGGRLIRHLSRGYQQRVGIAQAIVHEPAVLILDEPTNGLDPAQIRDVRALLTGLAGERAVIVSTHVLGEVRTLATRIAILHG